MDIFEQAAILKLRFQTPKGELTVENLFDKEMPLTSKIGHLNLDDLAKTVSKAIREDSEESFVNASTSSPAKRLNLLRLEILKHVIGYKQAENMAKADAATKAVERQRLLSLRDRKQDAALEGLSLAEIDKKIAELG